MAKGPHLTGRVKELLANIYLADRQVTPSKARELLLKNMRAEGLDEMFGSDYPDISTISKRLKALREIDEQRSSQSKGLDEPWSIAAMADYDIPPETLPVILKVWSTVLSLVFRDSGGDNDLELATDYMTVRLAQWIARLYYVFREQMPLFMKGIPEDKLTNPDSWLIYLLLYAVKYAQYERLIELIGYPSKSEVVTVLWPLDAELAGNKDLADKLGEGLGGFPDFRLLSKLDMSKLDKGLWPTIVKRGVE